MSIDCHIIFNEPTDREDWLARCIASLEHPAVSVHVHRFSESAPVRPRRHAIVQAHDKSRWIMFADPDDYALRPAYDRFIEMLLGTDEDVAWPFETVLREDGREGLYIGPHHLVALRRSAIVEYDPMGWYFGHVRTGAVFQEPAYCWVRHPATTSGGNFDG